MSTLLKEMDDDEVKLAIRGLINQANMYSMSYLNDPLIQHQFREEYRFLGKCLRDDYENGILAKNRIVGLVKQERQSLIDQALEIGRYGIGLIAGIGQLSTGYGLCVTESVFSFTGMSWCTTVGAPMFLHGGNNIYENSYNITGNVVQNWKGQYTGNYGDGSGYLRDGYRKAAKSLGMNERDGDLAYATVDLATSAYGLKNTLKPAANANVSGASQFKLFRYSAMDYSKGWKTMSRSALFVEVGANIETTRSATTPYLTEEE
ncbi:MULTISPECIES: DUF4225 domain-containing protein [unclassified Vibrio]|uniref:DUF4225 domain-containing protein n=1 Tax=unclassified Vibrio TaxID=2614977 RepID=UPI001360C4EF|nr:MULTISPECIES: DUF4225 domain-containing protein [unclassified Vibrio]NAW59500.1 DUF4225 domain-containing protein [Vibrio sp. V36_P2S2PM302]NAX25457.1 DUF4225 domain-containing protein [Vibrio sp. V38_P2S17PM301]NAX30361.1 DUF4225 domain-containing protein [Vibrio sp. V37_P2S8PM304]